jgi:hypothetical protein
LGSANDDHRAPAVRRNDHYIFVGIALEERDLITVFGDEYLRYQRRVSALAQVGPTNELDLEA